MPHTECAHRQAQTHISTDDPRGSCGALLQIRPTGRLFSSRAESCRSSRSFTWRRSLYRHRSPPVRGGLLLHITIFYPQFGVQSRNVNSSTFLSLPVLFVNAPVCHCRSRSSRYLYSKVNPSFFLWPHFS